MRALLFLGRFLLALLLWAPAAHAQLAAADSHALADFAEAKFVVNNSAQVGVSAAWLPMLGALKAAGAVGLLIGLLGFRPIGIAAAIGLVAFFIEAVATNVRAQVFYNIAFPLAVLALAVASLVVLM